jgi:hypothetical protein
MIGGEIAFVASAAGVVVWLDRAADRLLSILPDLGDQMTLTDRL